MELQFPNMDMDIGRSFKKHIHQEELALIVGSTSTTIMYRISNILLVRVSRR